MNKTTQDLAWACLPKAVREDIRSSYKDICGDNEIAPKILLEEIYGHHNLTSDTEPEEMLMVERKKVQDAYKVIESDMRRAVLEELFGDKCLPEKEPSVQGEPKKFFESDYDIGDKVVICISSIGEPRKEAVTLIRQYQPQCEYNDYAKTWVVQTQDGMTYQSNEEHFEPYTEPSNVPDNETKNNMKTNFVRRSDEPDNNFGGVESAASTLNIKDPEDIIETLDFLAERDEAICNEVNPAEEKAVQRAWCEYSNMEGVEGYVPLLLKNFEKAYELGRRDALAGQWRSVEDVLPKENDDVFVRYANYVGGLEYGAACYDGEDWWKQDGSHIRPTYWMPIPELP